MNDRDGHSQFGRQQNHGSGNYGNDFTDNPRQQHQFAEGARQAGGNWQDYGQSGYYSSGQMGGSYQGNYQPPRQYDRHYDDEQRRRAQRPETAYRSSHDDYGSGQGYVQQPRGYSGYSSGTYDASGGNDFGSFTSQDYGGRDFSAYRGGGAPGFASSESYRPSYGPGSWGRHREERSYRQDFGQEEGRRDYGEWRSYGERRGFLERAGDEIASWFGDEDAARRREVDHDHSGRGPSDYKRSDERIREDVNDYLTRDRSVDARNINVTVNNGDVTLAGTVDHRQAKRRAEDLADRISGVRNVQNNLRVQETARNIDWNQPRDATASASSATTASRASTTARATEKAD